MTLVLRGAALIDGSGRDPVSETAVVIDGNRIADVQRDASRAHPDAQVIDLAGLTLLPGLIDAHSHFGLVDFGVPGNTPVAVLAAQIFRNCELALDGGFTSVRDTGGIDGGIGDAINRGLLRGPRVYPSGPLIVQTGGHGDFTPPYLDHQAHGLSVPGLVQVSIACDGPDQVRAAARTAFHRGATQLKVVVSGGVVSLHDRLEDTQLTVEELRAAVDEARARETYVTAHAHNVRSIRNGMAAGVECFEHGTFLDEETAAAMSAAGAYLVPTLAVTHLFAQEWQRWGVPESTVPRMTSVLTAMQEAVKIAHRAGVVMGSGSDLIGPEQNRRGLELPLKARCIGAMEAIVSATATNARIMRAESDLGSVAPGKLADVIAVDGDPLADPELFDNSNRIVLVVKDGVIVKDIRRTAPHPLARTRYASLSS